MFIASNEQSSRINDLIEWAKTLSEPEVITIKNEKQQQKANTLSALLSSEST